MKMPHTSNTIHVSPSKLYVDLFIYSHAVTRSLIFFFFFNDPAPPEIYPLSLHDALPICREGRGWVADGAHAGWTQSRRRGAERGRAGTRRYRIEFLGRRVPPRVLDRARAATQIGRAHV